MVQVVRWLVEQAMPEPGSHQYAHEAVHEHRLELLVGKVLLPVEPVHQQGDPHQAEYPA